MASSDRSPANEPHPSTNPFCARRVRPGAIPFFFAPGQDADSLVERLRRNDWRGEIVGPHGVGKSALVAALLPAMKRAGRHPLLITLHDGQRRLPPDAEKGAGVVSSTPTVLVIDGYEQLSRWNRWRLARRCRRSGWGLLVTSHESVGLPELCRVAPSLDVAQTIVAWLAASEGVSVAPREVADCFVRHGGDLREMLFELYDRHEERRRAAKT